MLLPFAAAAGAVAVAWWPLLAVLSAAVWGDAQRALDFEAFDAKRRATVALAAPPAAAPQPAAAPPAVAPEGDGDADGGPPDLSGHLPEGMSQEEWHRAIEGRVSGWGTLRPSGTM